jgi:hypothetical protein
LEHSKTPSLEPFQVLRLLLDGSSLCSEEGMQLRSMIAETGALQNVFDWLTIFSHQNQKNDADGSASTSSTTKRPPPKKAKAMSGVGFGSGDRGQKFNIKDILMKKQSEEELVTILLQVILLTFHHITMSL